jgi:hypothetical protein
MKLALKWLTPLLLRLLSLSSLSLADTAASTAAAPAWGNSGSVHLVTGFYVGLAVSSQPRQDRSLDPTPTITFVPLITQEVKLPVMPL